MDTLPRFICLVGLDGSGKTTIANIIHEQMKHDGVRVRYVWGNLEPYISKVLRFLARIIFLRGFDQENDYTNYRTKRGNTAISHPRLTRIYTIVLKCEYIVQVWLRISIPMLLGSKMIVDRYLYDFALNLSIATGNDMPFTFSTIKSMLKYIPKPDIIFLLDIPEEVAFSRKDDIPEVTYLQERRNAYLRMAADLHFQVINATQSPSTVANHVMRSIHK